MQISEKCQGRNNEDQKMSVNRHINNLVALIAAIIFRVLKAILVFQHAS